MDYHISTTWAFGIALVVIWDLIWRGIALWYSGRRGQKVWFVVLLLVNSAGLLPILYLLTHRGQAASVDQPNIAPTS